MTKIDPRTFGVKYMMLTYAIPFGILEASVTPVKMVTISMTPSTQPRRVVWRVVNPNWETII